MFSDSVIFVACLVLALTGSTESDPCERLVGGHTLAAWQALFQEIDLLDADSRRYVPGLVAVMHDEAVPWITRRQAALTLGRLGPLARNAIPEVAQHLMETCPEDPETSPQRWALSALALFHREAKDVAPQLIEMLNDERNSVITRLGCLEALSQIGPAAPDGIAAIWELLAADLTDETQPEELTIGSIEALGLIGRDAASAVPVLLRAAQSDNADFRREAARSLGRIGPSAHGAETVLCDLMLADEAPVVRDVATASLSQIGPRAWTLVEPLLTVEDAEVRERAAQVVFSWLSISPQILPALEPLLTDPEPRARLAALRSWRSLTQRHDRVWPQLIDLLVSTNRDVRRGASVELQAIVQTGDVCDEELARLENDPRPLIQKEGVRLRRMRAMESR